MGTNLRGAAAPEFFKMLPRIDFYSQQLPDGRLVIDHQDFERSSTHAAPSS
jgi:hypothetical protein